MGYGEEVSVCQQYAPDGGVGKGGYCMYLRGVPVVLGVGG